MLELSVQNDRLTFPNGKISLIFMNTGFSYFHLNCVSFHELKTECFETRMSADLKTVTSGTVLHKHRLYNLYQTFTDEDADDDEFSSCNS